MPGNTDSNKTNAFSKHRLLLCDIGNTTMKFGLADGFVVRKCYVFPTRQDVTADSLGLELLSALGHAGTEWRRIDACVAASVVPGLNMILRQAASRYFGCRTMFAPGELAIPIENHYERPSEVGADRLVGAFAARRKFPEPPGLIVVDFGTAVTFDCIKENAYMGGLIFPGPATAVKALASGTAKLPQVGLDIPDCGPAPCRDTSTSIRHGLVFGYAALTEGLCARLAQQLPAPVKIVATGGFADVVGGLTQVFDAILPGLLLEGLVMLYNEHNIGE